MLLPRQDQQRDRNGKKETFNLIVTFARGLSLGTTVLIRRNFGSEGIAFPGLVTIGVILAFASYGRSPLMMLYLYIWLFALLCQRLTSASNRRKGIPVHSRWMGTPTVGYRLGAKDHVAAVRNEVGFCIVLGAVMLAGDPAVGLFIMASAVGSLVNTSFDVELYRARRQRLQDAQIEADYWSEQ